MAARALARTARPGGMVARIPADLGWSAAIVAVGALYYLVPGVAPSLALLAVLAYLCWRRTDPAVALIPLAVPLYMLPKHMHLLRRLDFSLGETVIVLCTAIVLAQQLLSLARRPAGVSVPRHLLPRSPFEWPALGFLVAAGLAALAARFHTVAFREYREVVLEPVLFYWLILQRLHGPSGALRLTLSVIGSGVLVAALGVLQIILRPQDLVVASFAPGSPHLVRAVYGNQNNLALLLDRAIPMALALVLAGGWLGLLIPAGQGALAGRRRRAAQAALLLSSALMLAVLYRTGSRGGELATGACLVALGAIWQRRRPLVLAAGAALIGLAALLARHRLASALTEGHGLTGKARVSVWETALRMIRDHPLLGVGPDNFLYYYSDDSRCAPGHLAAYYYRQEGVNFERCLSHPHNLFLDLWLSTGLLGLLAGLALLVSFALLGLRAYRRADAVWEGPLLAALMAMLALLVHGQVDNSYFLPDVAALFWLCLGVVALWECRPVDR